MEEADKYHCFHTVGLPQTTCPYSQPAFPVCVLPIPHRTFFSLPAHFTAVPCCGVGLCGAGCVRGFHCEAGSVLCVSSWVTEIFSCPTPHQESLCWAQPGNSGFFFPESSETCSLKLVLPSLYMPAMMTTWLQMLRVFSHTSFSWGDYINPRSASVIETIHLINCNEAPIISNKFLSKTPLERHTASYQLKTFFFFLSI